MRIVPGGPRINGPIRHRGRMNIRALPDGTFHAAAWPRKRGKPKSALQQAYVDAFAQIAHWAAHPDALTYASATQASDGLMLLPRDIMIRAAYGTNTIITLPDGTRYVPRRLVATDIQLSLDQVTSTPGAMLWRNADQWVGIPPGSPGNVLQYNGVATIPTWVPQSGGGTTVSAQTAIPRLADYSDDTGDAWPMMGSSFLATDAMTITAVYIFGNFPVGAVFTPWVAKLSNASGSPVLSALEVGPASDTRTIAGRQLIKLPLTTPLSVVDGDNFALGAIRTDGTTSTPSCISIDTGTVLLPFLAQSKGFIRENVLTLADGDTIGVGFAYPAAYFFGCDWSFVL